MTLYGSPDIGVQELDISTYVQPAATSVGAVVIDAAWGPVLYATTVSNEAELVSKFGIPNDRNYKDWFSVANGFLAYSNNCRVVRTVSSDAKNAADVGANAVLIKNDADFVANYSSYISGGKLTKVFAKYPGVFGNNLKVCLFDKTNALLTNPLSPYINRSLAADDIVFGVFNGSTLVEFGIYSSTPLSKDDTGDPNYFITAINKGSDYVYLIKENIVSYTGQTLNPININNLVLSSGSDGAALVDADYQSGWNLFKNTDTETVDLPFVGGASSVVGKYVIDNVATVRKDCFVSVSPASGDVVNNNDPAAAMTTARAAFGATSYGWMDGNYKYVYDQYNDKYRWVPLNGDMAGLLALTDAEEAPWFSPGGRSIKNCIKLAWYPDKANRDKLFQNNINIVTAFPNEGHVLFGDWTLYTGTSLNFVNVRRCLIFLERSISKAARKVMFKQNDEFTRARFQQTVEPFLRDVKGKRGLTDFKVYADSRVNTAEVIDRGEFVAKIPVKIPRSIRWVTLQFISTRSDAVFDEIIQ